MWKDLDFEQMEIEEWTSVPYPPFSKNEVEDMVVDLQVKFYNNAKNCGPDAIHEWFQERAINPTPSRSKIASILKKHHLTHGRTNEVFEELG